MTITPGTDASVQINARIAAQVAVEAVINCNGDGYERVTIDAVIANGEANGVAELYMEMIRNV